MLLTVPELLLLMLGFLVIATLYSSVGFGGGSSYLALLALVFVSFFAIRSTALICNLVVVSGSSYLYWKNGHLDFKKFLPFIITSIPFAFIGAQFRLQESTFFIILGASLIISALALVFQTVRFKKSNEVNPNYRAWVTYALGAVIGLLSGLVGIGGGIFLAPLLHLTKWDSPKRIAATSSFFILVNSIAGLTGQYLNPNFSIDPVITVILMVTVFIGGQIGSRLSVNFISPIKLKKGTALLIAFVGIRILWKYLF